MKNISLNHALRLAFFGFVTVAVIAITQRLTAPLIFANQQAAEAAALLAIVPAQLRDNTLVEDTLLLTIDELFQKKPSKVYFATKENKVTAVLLSSIAPDGYSGKIKIIVGIDITGTVLGVRVLDHKETPGLGDKIELRKSNWVESFAQKSLSQPSAAYWKVKKDGGEFDQFTGATVTPRAVVAAVLRSVKYFQQHQQELTSQFYNRGGE